MKDHMFNLQSAYITICQVVSKKNWFTVAYSKNKLISFLSREREREWYQTKLPVLLSVHLSHGYIIWPRQACS